MKIVIIEDEKPAEDRLKRMLQSLLPGALLQGGLDTVKAAVRWLDENPTPDLIFLDIQLADGLSFEIFQKHEVLTPVIFCTAYDQYAIKAFELNSIDYLLKPIDPADLDKAVRKFQQLRTSRTIPSIDLEQLQLMLKPTVTSSYKSRFITRVRDQLKPILVEHIHYFYSADKATYAVVGQGKHYLLDYSLEQLEELVNPVLFFRINRKYLVKMDSIEEIRTYSSSRLKLSLKACEDRDVLVSRDRVSPFKNWLDG